MARVRVAAANVEVMLRRAKKLLPSVVLAIVVAVGTWALVGSRDHSTITVTIAGRSARVPVGTTLGGAVSMFGLHAAAGDLLDVEGNVLRSAVVPSALLLNRHVAPGRTRLRAGDLVDVADAHNRREPVSRQILHGPGGIPTDRSSRSPGHRVGRSFSKECSHTGWLSASSRAAGGRRSSVQWR